MLIMCWQFMELPYELGLDSLETLRLLSELESVSGRFQYIVSDSNITAIVDYAHTPDALRKCFENNK